MSTFVSVGNATQPFTRLLKAVTNLAGRHLLPEPVFVQNGSTPFKSPFCKFAPFLNMQDFTNQIEKSDVIIIHGGAGSVIHACQAGKVPVVMPRLAKYGEIIDDHQVEFVKAMAEEKKVVFVERPENLYEGVQLAMNIQKKMAVASKKEPRMVQLVHDVLLEIAKEKKSQG